MTFAVRAEDLRVCAANPIAVLHADIRRRMRASLSQKDVEWIEASLLRWQMRGHPRPLRVDGNAYRHRTRRRRS